MPTLKQDINLMHRGQFLEIFESRWIVFGNPGHDEKKILKRLAGIYDEVKEYGYLTYN